MTRTKWIAGVSVLLVTVIGVCWAMGLFAADDPRLAEVAALQTQMIEKAATQQVPAQERAQMFTQMREKVDQLPPDLKQQAMETGRRMMMKFMEKRIDDYFALPPEKRVAELDKQIQEMEQMRASMQRNGGPPPGPPPAATAKDTQNPEDRRNAFRQRMLDNTSPEFRAKMSEYMQQMRARRQQLGLPNMPGGRW